MGRPKDTAKHDRILASAINRVKQGLPCQLDEIAKEASVSKMTIYSHFKNQQTLVDEAHKALAGEA